MQRALAHGAPHPHRIRENREHANDRASHPAPHPPMKRVVQAPNLAIATLWADWLTQAGVVASVQRAYASSIAGEIPPDQALPEVWVADETQLDTARRLLAELRSAPHRHWVCRACHERVDGPFEQCWNCGAMMPR
jgi:hypothetical protein